MAVNYNILGSCIDNVFNNITKDSSRKAICKLNGEVMFITFLTIKEFARDLDIFLQTREFEEEARQIISKKVKDIKEKYAESGEKLKLTEIKEEKNKCAFETLTVSPISPKRTIKCSYTVQYKVA